MIVGKQEGTSIFERQMSRKKQSGCAKELKSRKTGLYIILSMKTLKKHFSNCVPFLNLKSETAVYTCLGCVIFKECFICHL